MDLSQQRLEYTRASLRASDLEADPFRQFELWYQQAVKAQVLEPNAMVIATVAGSGEPTQRTVLLKYFDANGFVFFTNLNSRKAQQIAEHDGVSLLFLWLDLQRQLEISGRAKRVSAAEAIKYFATRPRGNQLGAWVSQQSSVISSRSLLESKLAEIKRKFSSGSVPIPSFWGGYRVVPHRFEFWQGRPNRLHDRFEYLRDGPDRWTLQRLAP